MGEQVEERRRRRQVGGYSEIWLPRFLDQFVSPLFETRYHHELLLWSCWETLPDCCEAATQWWHSTLSTPTTSLADLFAQTFQHGGCPPNSGHTPRTAPAGKPRQASRHNRTGRRTTHGAAVTGIYCRHGDIAAQHRGGHKRVRLQQSPVQENTTLTGFDARRLLTSTTMWH